MKRLKIVGMALVAVFAISAVVVAPAFASSTTNPSWYVAGTKLTGTENIEAKAVTTQELTSSAAKTISCKKVALNTGAAHFIENMGSPLFGGEDKETLTYSECTYPESGCHVKNKGGTNGTIVTDALTSLLAYKTEAEAEKEEVKKGTTLTVFKPASGSTFVEIEFEGSGCPIITSASVEGSVAVENDGEVGTEPGAEATTHEITAPSTLIKKAYCNEGGAPKEVKTEFKVFGGLASAGYIGTSLVSIEGGTTDYSIQKG
jgi:hypothetical protein